MRFNRVLEKLTPYRASPPLAEIKQHYGLERLYVMSANEVPWGPFPEVVEKLKQALDGLNRYPDGNCGELRAEIARQLGVAKELLVFGNGSCEILMLLGQAFLGPDSHVVFPEPSFVMYRSIALAREAPFTAVALPNFRYDLQAMLDAIEENTSMIVVCNPNNPTGTYIESRELCHFLEQVPSEVLVVLDEAYGEFVTSPLHEDSVLWLERFPNLVVLRTFSKIYGLAGLRVGYAFAAPEVVTALDKIRQPFNVDSLAQIAALESLRHPERVRERRQKVAAERERVSRRLHEMGIATIPSQANFLLVDVSNLSIPGPEVPQALLERGILTRSGYAMGCPGWIRVTIGEVEEGDAFLAAMADLVRGGEFVPRRTALGLTADALSPES
ncbi:MAG: histidinol-phosphate transaminase [Thermoleophilia bacterium]|nr:histidinol-phosphate transaminase [Thermoleophilia bacterium]